MHSRDPQKSDAEFQREFEAILKIASSGEDATAHFEGFIFPSANYRGREFAPWCMFWGATFMRDADFGAVMFMKSVSFNGAKFTRNTKFDEVTFVDGAHFRETVFMQDVSFGEARFKDEADFFKTSFTKNADFGKVSFAKNADFFEASFTRDAQFSGATFAQAARFSGATFVKKSDFNGARFTQNAKFSRATFGQDSDFRHARFTQDADFVGATFTLDAKFSGATFTRNAKFSEATFAKGVHFSSATFARGAYFRKATFTQDATFLRATFTRNADFTLAGFSQMIFFEGATFLGPAQFRETRFRRDEKPFPGPIFSLAEFARPETIVFYKTYLGQALFHNCDVSKVTFSSVEWGEREGKRMVFEEKVDLASDLAEDLRPAEGSPDERNYGLIAELYQQLKKNYDERKDYWTAGDFHYGEMEMKRLANGRKNKILRWLVQNLRLVAWYRWASEYGESYARPALWLATILFAFALLYPVAGLHYDSAKDPHAVSGAAQTSKVLTYWDPFVPGQASTSWHRAQWRLFGHSCVTALDVATFQRDRTYEPAYPLGRLLFLLEVLLIPTLFGLFLLAVQRQFRR